MKALLLRTKSPMFGKLENFIIVAGSGSGRTHLNAFDAALHDAGISRYNLIRVSSILPPGARERENITLPAGSLLPIAYGSIESSEEGTLITAGVSVAIPENTDDHGVIMEYSGYLPEEDAKKLLVQMAEDAMIMRKIAVREVKVRTISRKVKGIVSVFAGVALF